MLHPLFRSHIFGKTTRVGSILIEHLEIHAKNFHEEKKKKLEINLADKVKNYRLNQNTFYILCRVYGKRESRKCKIGVQTKGKYSLLR